MEGYYLPSDAVKEESYHISVLVKNEIGRKNLYKLVSISNLEYFYNKPIILKKELDENREGLLIGSSCKAGELYRAIVEGKTDEEIEQIANYYDYLEIQPIANNHNLITEGIIKDEEELKDINRKIVELGIKLNKTVIATGDVHFINQQDDIYRSIIKEAQGNKYAEEQTALYFRTTEEMLKEFEYLGQDKAYEVVVTNTNKIVDICEKIRPISDEKCYPHIENIEMEIKELAYDGAYSIYGNPLPTEVKERLDKELNSIIENEDFATLYMIAQKLVKKSNEDGYIVGSRGGIASSLVAYCIGITEVDPIKYKIPFETFAGFYGEREPDIDLNFAGEIQENIQEYVKETTEGVRTYKAGTIGTIVEKTAYGYVKKYFEEKEVVADNAKIERVSREIVGIKRTTGKHSGGIIVVPKGREIYEFTPIQHPANNLNTDDITTHFDYHAIDRNLLKLDILGHDDPTMLHRLQELSGISPTTIDLKDKETMEMICTANTLGIPEFATKFVRDMIIDTKPTTFDELIKVSGLSHGTDVWLNNAQELIAKGTATLKEVIACRDDIMNDLIEVGIERKIAFEIMETVRKGKIRRNREPHWEEYKKVMIEHNVPKWYIESCEKISYMFPKAHATVYVINAFRIAWYKVHYPEAFYKAYFEIKSDLDIKLLNNKEKILQKLRELEETMKTSEEYWRLSNKVVDCQLALEMFERNVRSVSK